MCQWNSRLTNLLKRHHIATRWFCCLWNKCHKSSGWLSKSKVPDKKHSGYNILFAWYWYNSAFVDLKQQNYNTLIIKAGSTWVASHNAIFIGQFISQRKRYMFEQWTHSTVVNPLMAASVTDALDVENSVLRNVQNYLRHRGT